MHLLLILIHVLALLLLLVIGMYGAYLTKPVLPIPEAVPNWTGGIIAWSLYWSFVAWQLTVPLTYGLWFNGVILGLKDVWATILWVIIIGFICGIVIGIRYHMAYKSVSFWAFLAGFALTSLLFLGIDAIVYILAGKFYAELFTIGSLEYLNFSDITNVVGLVLQVLYPVVTFVGARKMQMQIAHERKIIIKK